VSGRLDVARLASPADMRRLELAEIDRCSEALVAPIDEGREIRRQFQRDESGTLSTDLRTPPDEAATMRRRLTDLAMETRQIVDRVNQARLILEMIDLFTEQSGPTVDLINPRTWPAAA
jgi:hypothetical protein